MTGADSGHTTIPWLSLPPRDCQAGLPFVPTGPLRENTGLNWVSFQLRRVPRCQQARAHAPFPPRTCGYWNYLVHYPARCLI